MIDQLEKLARRFAAYGYLGAAFAAGMFILIRGSMQIIIATSILLTGFVTYCVLSDEEDDDSDY